MTSTEAHSALDPLPHTLYVSSDGQGQVSIILRQQALLERQEVLGKMVELCLGF